MENQMPITRDWTQMRDYDPTVQQIGEDAVERALTITYEYPRGFWRLFGKWAMISAITFGIGFMSVVWFALYVDWRLGY